MGCLASKEKSAATTKSQETEHEKGEYASQPKSETKTNKDEPVSLLDEEGGVRREPIEDFYELGKEIGRGGFSVVIECTEKKTGEKYAIKCIKKTMVEGDDIKLLRREIAIMKGVSHPNILKLYEVFEDEDEFFLVMEL